MLGTCPCAYSVGRRGAPDPHYLCLPVLDCPHLSHCYSSKTDRCFLLIRLSLFGLCGYRAGLRPGEEGPAQGQPGQLACLPTWLLFLRGCGGYRECLL